MEIASIECHARESSGERSRHRNTLPLPFARELIVCSRRSDSRALEKNSGRKKKGRLEGERGGNFSRSRPPSPAVFPVYNLTRSPLTAALYYLNAWNRLVNRRLRLRFSKGTCLLSIERVILTTVSTIGCGSTGRLLSKGPVKSFPSLYIPKNCTRSVIELYTALRTFLDISEATEAKK